MKHWIVAACLAGAVAGGAPAVAAAGMMEREIAALEALAAKGSPRARQELQDRLAKDDKRGRVRQAYCTAVRDRILDSRASGKGSRRVTVALNQEKSALISAVRAAAKPVPAARCTTLPAGRAVMVPSPPPAAIKALVHKMAPAYGLDPDLVLAVIAVESNFRAGVVSDKNAMGLMQLIPETAERFGVANVFDAEDNIRGGMKYLRWLLAHFDGDVTLALAGYNAGEGAVRQYGGIPPYRETQDYVVKVHSLYRPARHPFDRTAARSAGVGRELVAELSFAAPRRDR
ncbi:soluble lytic murein transglycosylase-like protein [Azospirillum fermentarium]|uniref:lytic transglycosylase domain-containing protein n=1 Tax=Azospirillum fermentarium TaxID=1233114 RepID=UPI0022274A5D|nr:lytic transglycosylase domain-containing protein [Azospirillum fermentarium]MCW2246978.1 soluble lytic murein transglycosylase-like protein [Azospirillum fermentarium]